jgi:group II intron reverse transcriptase/maturase
MELQGGYVVGLDIRKYFDSVDHRQIQQVFRQRVRDGVLRRLIGKWLNAGVMEQQRVSYPQSGVPQGGVISPMLSNIYLHEVLDTWFEQQVKPRLRGKAFMVRFADDAVLVFERQDDAQRVMEVLPERMAKYGLQLHPDKTHLVRFVRPPIGRQRDDARGQRGADNGTFDFLGFTHYWGGTRRGGWAAKQRTAQGRLTRALRRTKQWMRRVRHWPIAEQHRELSRKIEGHINYYGIRGNHAAISRFIYEVQRLWRKWLGRRSHKAHRRWDWFNQLIERFALPRPRLRRCTC